MSKLGDELLRSMAQALAHAEGRRHRSRVRTAEIHPDEIQKARKPLGLSEDQFADAFGVSASTLRNGTACSGRSREDVAQNHRARAEDSGAALSVA